jgi:hypothetical protein
MLSLFSLWRVFIFMLLEQLETDVGRMRKCEFLFFHTQSNLDDNYYPNYLFLLFYYPVTKVYGIGSGQRKLMGLLKCVQIPSYPLPHQSKGACPQCWKTKADTLKWQRPVGEGCQKLEKRLVQEELI